MPEGGAETRRTLCLVNPCNHMLHDTLLPSPSQQLLTGGQGLCIKKLLIVIKLFPCGDPITQGRCDGVIGLGKMNVNGLLRAMAS